MLELLILIIAVILAFEIWMFIDAFKNPSLNDRERALWCIGMVLLHPVVAIIYYFVAYSGRNGI